MKDMAFGILGDSFLAVGPPIDVGGVTKTYPYVSRAIPWAIPFRNDSNKKYLWASAVEAEGLGTPSGNVQISTGVEGKDSISLYNTARLTVQFDTRMYDIMSDADFTNVTGGDVDEARLIRYVTKTFRPSGENLALAGNAYYFAGLGNTPATAVPLSNTVTKQIVTYNLALTWHFIPEAGVPSTFINPGSPNLAIDNCLGRVNNDYFHGCRQGTLLLMAVELKPMISALGNRIYDITYMFKYMNPAISNDINGYAIGHNHVFRPYGANDVPRTNRWWEMIASKILATTGPKTNFVVRTDGMNPYDWADFKTLFRPALWTP